MKILIVSHNCFSSFQNMGKTFVSLFNKFDKNELMQLYLYPSIPNVDVCDSYFRITDRDALKSIVKRKHCGGVVAADTSAVEKVFDSADAEKQYNSINRDSSLARRARDCAWKISGWKSKELKAWLNEGKPDAVFYALGDASFSQNIAMWVSRYLDIPLVTYVCDEFYFSGKKAGVWQRAVNAFMLSNIKKTIKRSSMIVSICGELGEAYKSAFGVSYTTIMTGSSFESGSLQQNCEKQSNQISYIGNLSLNRYKNLLEIQEALDKVNENSERKYELVYYGREHGELKDKVKYGGFLDQDGVRRAMADSLMLVHTETFEDKLRARLKYSVSTKIADSLASGTCLLAYGPAELASVSHLINNNCACCITEKEMLFEKLDEILKAPEIIAEYAQKGIEVASHCHSSDKNSKRLYEALSGIVEENNKTKEQNA